MSVLRALAERDAGFLAELRASDRASLMVRLVHTECLLELARVSVTGVDMASYADMVVDTMEQLLPLIGCAVSVDVEGVPVLRAVRGDPDAAGRVRAPFDLGGYGSGLIEVAFDAAELGPPEFVEALTEQVAAGLLNVVEAERLRRQAALADTARLAAALGDAPTEPGLRSLVEAIAYLPNVVGVSLEVVHPVVGGTVLMSCGLLSSTDWISRSVEGGFIRMAVAWAVPEEADAAVVSELVDRIGSALSRAEEHRRLMQEAQTDALTGVANRRRATQVLDMTLALARLNEDVLAVACFDLDRFKEVNDRFGHAAGDDVLVRFAGHLKSSVRRSDTVARMGGEEFLLICPGLEEPSGRKLLQGIVDRTADACRSDQAPGWHQTVSVGLAVHPFAGSDPEGLLRAADVALYAVKGRGGNGVECASEPE